MNAVEKLLDIARAEIGYLEKASNAQLDDKVANAGRNNWNKFARDLDAIGFYNGPKNGYEWCDIFVDACFVKAFGVENALLITGQKRGGLGAGCTFSANYYRNIDQFHERNPIPGDQIFFTRDGGRTSCHTGLVEKVENGRVYTIEGNTSGASGVVSNGGGVCRKSYLLDDPYIYGYGTPNYNLIAEEDDYMTRAQILEEIGDKFIERFDDLPEWAKPDMRELLDTGIINGGTSYDVNPDDINLLLSDVKAIIIAKRLIAQSR